MKWLFYYELRKTRQARVVLLGVTAVLQLIFCLSLLTRDTVAIPMSGSLLFITAAGGTLYLGLDSLLTFHRDLRTDQGYMVFMTPHNCWQILGAKMLQNALSLMLIGGIFIGLIYLDVVLMMNTFKSIQNGWTLATGFLNDPNLYLETVLSDLGVRLNFSIDFRDGTLIICAYVVYVCTWLSFISMAYLSDTLAVSLVPSKPRVSVCVAFGVFIVLAYITLWLQTLLPALSHYQTSLLMASGLALGSALVMYVATAILMELRLSV